MGFEVCSFLGGGAEQTAGFHEGEGGGGDSRLWGLEREKKPIFHLHMSGAAYSWNRQELGRA